MKSSNMNLNNEPAKNWCLLILPHSVEAGDKMSVLWTDGKVFGITFPQSCRKGANILVTAPGSYPPSKSSLPTISSKRIKNQRIASALNQKRKRSNDELSKKKEYEDAFKSILWPFMRNMGWKIQNEKTDKRSSDKRIYIPPESYRVRVNVTNSMDSPKQGIVRGIDNVIELIKTSSDYDKSLREFREAVKTNVDQNKSNTKKHRRSTRHSMRLYTWKYCGKLYPNKQSCVGENYQVAALPLAGSMKSNEKNG